MKMPRKTIAFNFISLILVLATTIQTVSGQKQGTVIDKIVANVGDEIILLSELREQMKYAKSGNAVALEGTLEAQVIESMLMTKLLQAQASIDSIMVTEKEVEMQLDNRMKEFLRYAGSEERLEKHYNKKVAQIRNELRDATREQLIVEKMKDEIVKDVKVTPAEVRIRYNKVPQDSLPTMPEKLMIAQITRKPKFSQEEKDRIQKTLREYRDKIYQGGSFATYAVLYSEDPGSASRGGELGFKPRAEFVEEFANVAFNLKPGKISKIVETEFGFHIIQLIERRGDQINVRHILLKPRVEEEYKEKAKLQLDTIRNSILKDEITFDEAAMRYSDDKDTRNNGGLLMNPRTMGAYLQKPELPPVISRNLEGVEEGGLSSIFYDTSEAVPSFKFFVIKKRIPEHKANLNEDWEIFENLVISEKKQEVLSEWIEDKIKDTYIEINKNISREGFKYKWTK